MATIDLVLLGVLGGFIVAGFFAGLFQTFGSIIGILAGYFVAAQYYAPFGDMIEPIVFGRGDIADVVAFILIFLLTSQLVGLVFWFIAKAFQLLKFIPFFSILNKLGGAVLGFIEGLFAIGIILVVIDRFVQSPDLAEQVANSQLAQLMINAAGIVESIFPDAFSALESVL
ncbi:MAG: CvpA family protein [Patescibacteria group bacterium]|nr:CvpA family protein [Patescibacteria group bacterium]